MRLEREEGSGRHGQTRDDKTQDTRQTPLHHTTLPYVDVRELLLVGGPVNVSGPADSSSSSLNSRTHKSEGEKGEKGWGEGIEGEPGGH